MAETQTPADPEVFTDTDRYDIELTEADLLGTHEYEDVLYTGSTDVVNVVTGETPSRLDRSAEQAKEFAQECGEDRVAVKQPPEPASESGSPYVASVFYNRRITGGMQWHTVFRKATESDAYEVEYEADYNSGTLTITVERA
jgi:hypothetical protein